MGVLLLGWYVAGNEVMRRRAARLAVWGKRALDPLGGRQAIRWLTLHSFRLEFEDARPPFVAGSLTGLTESWDVPMVWLWNRLRGRRDMVLLQLALRRPPAFGLELYRPGTLLAGDARHFGRQAGWAEAPLDGFRLVAAGTGEGGGPAAFAQRLLNELGEARPRLVRLGLRRRGTHLTLALNVPDPSAFSPADFHRLVERLARAAMGGATSATPTADERAP